jgi:hypothetical protein
MKEEMRIQQIKIVNSKKSNLAGRKINEKRTENKRVKEQNNFKYIFPPGNSRLPIKGRR